MSKKSPVEGFGWVEDIPSLNEKRKRFIKFIKKYDEESDDGYMLEVDVEYPKDLHNLDNVLPFLPERMKINRCNKLVCKNKYVVHIGSLK